jgi:NDP-sugar pyrophosphorylase family protein
MPAIKGVILAAGLGSRLKPLTDSTPKPLLPFCGVPIFYLAISRLLQAGITEIAANAHYLPQQIAEAAKKNPFSKNIYVSVETPEILGTGGVYGNLHKWRDRSAVLAVNGDIVSDFNLHSLCASHRSGKPWVTLGLVKGANPIGNSVWIDRSNKVAAISVAKPAGLGELSPHIFSGFQVLSDEILCEFRENTPADLISVFQNGLRTGKCIQGIYQDCFWHDLGTPSSYFLAHKEFLETDIFTPAKSRIDRFGYFSAARKMNQEVRYFPAASATENYTILGPSLFFGNVTVRANAILGPYVIAAGDIEIPAGSHIKTSIILDSSDLVYKNALERVIIHNGLITSF